MDKLASMKAFVRVVEAGTFTKAADSLGVPKAQVSRLVQSLESELKTLLLNRTTRRVAATADGAAYYERAARVLDEIDELESEMTHAKIHPRGRLRVEVPPPVANHILIPLLDDFCSRYPDIRLELGVGERSVDMVGENIDCVLHTGEIADPSLVARRVADVRRVVCAAPAYLKRFGLPQHPADLEGAHHRIVTYFNFGSDRLTYRLQRGEERYEVEPRSILAVNDSSSMLSAALAGMGIARTTAFMAAPHLAAGRLQVVLPEWSAGALTLSVVYPPNRHVSARLRVFIDWAVDIIRKALDEGSTPPPAKSRRTADV